MRAEAAAATNDSVGRIYHGRAHGQMLNRKHWPSRDYRLMYASVAGRSHHWQSEH